MCLHNNKAPHTHTLPLVKAEHAHGRKGRAGDGAEQAGSVVGMDRERRGGVLGLLMAQGRQRCCMHVRMEDMTVSCRRNFADARVDEFMLSVSCVFKPSTTGEGMRTSHKSTGEGMRT